MKDKIDCDENKSWLLGVPDEIKIEVLKWLSPKDLLSVGSTCRQLNGLIKDPALWTELNVDLSDSRRSMIWRITKYHKKLIISNKFGLDISDTRLRNKIANVVRRVPQLKSIEFEEEMKT